MLVEAALDEQYLLEKSAFENRENSTPGHKVVKAVVACHVPSLPEENPTDFAWAVIVALLEREERAYSNMLVTLHWIQAWYDALQLANEARKRFPGTAFFKSYVEIGSSQLSALDEMHFGQGVSAPEARTVGRLHRVHYPWIAREEYKRSKKVAKKIKVNVEAASNNAIVQPGSLCGGNEGSLGVFAHREIPKGERIVMDYSIFSTFNSFGLNICEACCGPLSKTSLTLEWCKAVYCSVACRMEAIKSYHKSLCCKDFNWLCGAYSKADPLTNEMVPLLMVKLLATVIQHNPRPLKIARVGGMQAGYGKETPSYFKLYDNVIVPTKILQTLGVDIFTDRRFDSKAI